jgi:pyrophosphatase PpaX
MSVSEQQEGPRLAQALGPDTALGSTPAFAAVIFDLDGTVVDSVELIVLSFQHAMREVLGLEVSKEEAVRNVGKPLREQMLEVDAEQADELVRVYREFNHREHDRLLCLYDGMLALLRRLHAAGVKLGLVTSKSRHTTQMAFDLTGIEPLFDQTVCSDEAPRNKPEPDPILYCLQLLGVPAGRSAYVGDSPFDMQAARAAQVTAVGVSWGVFPEAVLRAESPDILVGTIGELSEVLGV